jgi:hypothetical protein
MTSAAPYPSALPLPHHPFAPGGDPARVSTIVIATAPAWILMTQWPAMTWARVGA